MTPAQECLFVLAHVLLALALTGQGGAMPQLLSATCSLAALLGLAQAIGDTRRRP